MDTIEASGRTLEEAVQIAAQELGVSVDAVEYEIVEEGAKGFLGLGQVPTTIQARVKEGYVPSARPAPAPVSTFVEDAGEEMPIDEIIEDEEIGAPVAGGDEFAQSTLKMVTQIIDAMDIPARVTLKSVEPVEFWIDINGRDVSALIGRQGQTLDALQYLVGLIVNRDPQNKRRVILDAEGYRMRYQEMLERKAHEYANAVKQEGKEAVLEPQPARDRRIVHLALIDDPDVYTYSESEGDDRHVVISPKK